MKVKRVRVLIPASRRDYVAAADLVAMSPSGDMATIINISGLDPELCMGLDSRRILGRKRSGKRGNRQRSGTT